MPFENVLGLVAQLRSEQSTAVAAVALRLRGLDQRDAAFVSAGALAQRGHRRHVSGLTNICRPGADLADPDPGRAHALEGQAPLNPLKVDSDKCMIDSTAIVMTAAAELLGAQKSETAALKGQQGASLHSSPDRALGSEQARCLGDGPGHDGPADLRPARDALHRLHSGAVRCRSIASRISRRAGSSQELRDRAGRFAAHAAQLPSSAPGRRSRSARRLFSGRTAPAGSIGTLSRNGELFCGRQRTVRDYRLELRPRPSPGVISLPFPSGR